MTAAKKRTTPRTTPGTASNGTPSTTASASGSPSGSLTPTGTATTTLTLPLSMPTPSLSTPTGSTPVPRYKNECNNLPTDAAAYKRLLNNQNALMQKRAPGPQPLAEGEAEEDLEVLKWLGGKMNGHGVENGVEGEEEIRERVRRRVRERLLSVGTGTRRKGK